MKRDFLDCDLQSACDFIKQYEGVSLSAYTCPAGVLTIGYGHTGDVREGQYISEEEALDLLVEDLRAHAERLAPKVKVQVTDGQYIALLSLAFNVGVGAVAKSTLLRLLNAGDIEAAGDEFLKGTYADGRELPGLVRRRRDERKLFLEGTR